MDPSFAHPPRLWVWRILGIQHGLLCLKGILLYHYTRSKVLTWNYEVKQSALDGVSFVEGINGVFA